MSTQAPLLTKSPQLLFIRKRGVSIVRVHTAHSHPHIPRHALHRDARFHRHTPSLVCSFVLYGQKRENFQNSVAGLDMPVRMEGGEIKVLSCKIKIQPSSSVRPQGMVGIEQHRRCEMEFASVLTDPCVRECVTAYESK